MTNTLTAQQLIDEMLANPRKFDDEGRAHDLLQHYFAGFPLETLRPLLRSNDRFVQRSASFIASELGIKSVGLVDDVIPLLRSTDVHVQYYAAEVLAVCCHGESAEKYRHIIELLEAPHEGLRELVRDLMGRADPSQRDVIRRYFESRGQLDEARRWA
jgi:hypothetical protein